MQFVQIAIILSVFMVTYYAMTTITTKNAPEGKSLYERLGGIFAISAVINDFSDAIVTDPMVGKDSENPQLRDWHRNNLGRLPGLKWMRTLWVANVSGGPYEYVPTKPGSCNNCLDAAHKDLKISSDEFDRVASILSDTLDKFKVPEKEKMEVLGAFAAHKKEVVSSKFLQS